ncbi:MAG: protein phosphatase 2C domain-containing protein [bacterium]
MYRELVEQGLVALAVADGVGDHPGHPLAAEIACRTTLTRFAVGAGDIPTRLRAAIGAAHDEIQNLPGEAAGAMSTLVCAVWVIGSDDLFCCGIGDSRIYLVGGAGARQITRDDSRSVVVHRDGKPLLAGGSAQQIRGITNALGHRQPPVISIRQHQLTAGEMVALATDGCVELGGFERNLVTALHRTDLQESLTRLVFGNYTGHDQDDATLLLLRRRIGPVAEPERYRQLFLDGEDFQAAGLFGQAVLAAALAELSNAVGAGDLAAVSRYLDYLGRHSLKPRRDDLKALLDSFPEDGHPGLVRIYNRIAGLLRE